MKLESSGLIEYELFFTSLTPVHNAEFIEPENQQAERCFLKKQQSTSKKQGKRNPNNIC